MTQALKFDIPLWANLIIPNTQCICISYVAKDSGVLSVEDGLSRINNQIKKFMYYNNKDDPKSLLMCRYFVPIINDSIQEVCIYSVIPADCYDEDHLVELYTVEDMNCRITSVFVHDLHDIVDDSTSIEAYIEENDDLNKIYFN